MKLSERQRYLVTALCLSATLAIAAVSRVGQESEDPGREAGAAQVSKPEKKVHLASLQVSREPVDSVDVDIFMAKTWQPPAPPPAASVPAAAPREPKAPALPFAYAGQLGDPQTGKVIVYLTRGETVYTVSLGDVIDERYRLEAIEERQITFVYLPMETRQVLVIPGP